MFSGSTSIGGIGIGTSASGVPLADAVFDFLAVVVVDFALL